LSLEIKHIENSLSLLNRKWKIKKFDERKVIFFTQKFKLTYLIAKLLTIREVKEDSVVSFLNPDINLNIPDPFNLKDMKKAVKRVIKSLENNEKIGIIADYDVDGSTSAAILFKFLRHYTSKISLKIPNRLLDGYGPNLKIMNEMKKNNVGLIFTLDCGTTSNGIIDNKDYSNIDKIIIDHHLTDKNLPNVHSIINPNRDDESGNYKEMAAVGVTFLFLMALRKELRLSILFNKFKEPNLLSFLDLVALGTVCDIVNLKSYNRVFVKKGLEIIHKRHHKGIAKLIDNSKISSSPTSIDLGFKVGPQINAASRLDDSSLASKFLITNDNKIIESISRKLFLLNEKRKLIENKIFNEANLQAINQRDSNYILVYGNDWHPGVLGIVASKISDLYFKPAIVISFINDFGIGSARSIEGLDLGKIILNAKNKNILINGGGHSMAAGLKISINNLDRFNSFLKKSFKIYDLTIYQRIDEYDSVISVNELNTELVENLEILQPFGKGNPEPSFILTDIKIDSIKYIKDKHILIFFQNDIGNKIKGICFNAKGTILGDHLEKYKKFNFLISCNLSIDKFSRDFSPQIVIKDILKID
tara:strand:+ start:4043 stop:5809 length:1767 start_codon:yes stop_codon:yes gene_type:complete